MEWYQYYLIYAVSGALTAWWAIYLPSIRLLDRFTDGEHPILQWQLVSSLVWITLAMITMPILTIVLLSENKRKKFIKSLVRGYLRKEND